MKNCLENVSSAEWKRFLLAHLDILLPSQWVAELSHLVESNVINPSVAKRVYCEYFTERINLFLRLICENLSRQCT